MFNRAEKIFAGSLFAICTIVAIIGYSFSHTPSPPPKIWFDASGGDVIFDHAYHIGLANCDDCHHNYEEDQDSTEEMKCRDCHYFGEALEVKSEDPTHPRFIGANCIDCHKSAALETACNTCHIRPGYAFQESGRVMPPLPDSVIFETDNGLVTFDHKMHTGEDVDETCSGCHHQRKGDTDLKGMEYSKSCRSCHYEKAANIHEYDDEYHTRYIGANCTNCHDTDSCEDCHIE